MTPQSTTAVAERVRTPEAPIRSDNARYWDVHECRWQGATYPLARYALERCTTIGRPVADDAPETRP